MTEPTLPLPDELLDVVEAMRRDRLSDERVAKIGARLAPLVGGGGAAGGGAAGGGAAPASGVPTSKSGKGGLATKLVGALLVVGALTFGVRAFLRSPSVPTPNPSPIASIASIAATASTEPVSDLPPTSTPAAASVSASTSTKPMTSAFAKPTPSSDAVAEEEILGRARAALAAEPAKALTLTAQHGARFPNGMLAQEREQIAIEALVALGRKAEATARARRFVAIWPRSPYVARLRMRSLID